MIIETCPECGGELRHYQILTMPPFNVRECSKCGWKYEELEKIEYRPFVPPTSEDK